MLTIDAGIACTGRILALLFFHILVIYFLFLSERTRHLGRLIQLELGGDGFSCAIGDLAILHKALDQPMAVTRAVMASIYASLAQIVVTIIADVAMIVLVRHRLVTNIAKDGPGWWDRLFNLRTNSEVTLTKWLYDIVVAAGAERVSIHGQLVR